MAKNTEPLTESYFYILLCLYQAPNHGYGIMQMTGTLSGGRVTIGSGTMYGATGNMLKKGWIAEVTGSDRRRMYRLTDLGREVFLAEYRRLAALTESAKSIIASSDKGENV